MTTLDAWPTGGTSGLPGVDSGVGVHLSQFTQDRYHWSLSGGIVYQNPQSFDLPYAPLSFTLYGGGTLSNPSTQTDVSGNGAAMFKFGTTTSDVTVTAAGASGTVSFNVTPEDWLQDHQEGYISASLSATGGTAAIPTGDTRTVQAHVESTTWWIYRSNWDSTKTMQGSSSTSVAGGASVTWSVISGDGTATVENHTATAPNDPTTDPLATSPTVPAGDAMTTFTMGNSDATVQADVVFLGSRSTSGTIGFTVDTSEHWTVDHTEHVVNGLALTVNGTQGSLKVGDQRAINAALTWDSWYVWKSTYGNTSEGSHSTIPADGETVAFSIQQYGGGTLSAASVTTDVNGNAGVTFTMGSSESTVQADVGGLTATTIFSPFVETWTKTGVRVDVTDLSFAPAGDVSDLFPAATGTLNATVTGDIYDVWTSDLGNTTEYYAGRGLVSNLGVTFPIYSGDALLSSSSGTTDGNGVASVGFTMGAEGSTVRVNTSDPTANSVYATVALTAHEGIWSGALRTEIFTTIESNVGTVSIVPGSTPTVTARVMLHTWEDWSDDLGHTEVRYDSRGGAKNALVTFSVTAGDGYVGPPAPEVQVPTDSDGYASTLFTMGTVDTTMLAVGSYLATEDSSADLTFSVHPFEYDSTVESLSLTLSADPESVTAKVERETWIYYSNGATVELQSHSVAPEGQADVEFVGGGSAALRTGPPPEGGIVSAITPRTNSGGSASALYACGGGGTPGTITASASLSVLGYPVTVTATLTVDGDGDGYSDALELVRGTSVGDYYSHPAPPTIQTANVQRSSGGGVPLPAGTLPDGIVGVWYVDGNNDAVQLNAGNILGNTVNWSASNLPPGLAFDADTLTFYGTPAVAGSYPVSVTVKDYYPGCYYPAEVTQYFTLVIYDPLVITTSMLPDGDVGVEYTDGSNPFAQLTATGGNGTGGTATYLWSVTGLPAGLLWDPNNGIISGAPEESGDFPLYVTVNSGYQSAETWVLEITVNPPPEGLAIGIPKEGTKNITGADINFEIEHNVIPENRKQTEGGWVLLNFDDDDNDGGARINGQNVVHPDLEDANGVAGENDLITLGIKEAAIAGASYRLKFHNTNIRIWMKRTKGGPNEEVISEQTLFTIPTGGKWKQVFIEGVKPHQDDQGTIITEQIKVGAGEWTDGDFVKVRVAIPIIAFFGEGKLWQTDYDNLVAMAKIRAGSDPTRNRDMLFNDGVKETYLMPGKTQAGTDVCYSLSSVWGVKAAQIAKITLALKDTHIIMNGHANWGIGMAFDKGFNAYTQFFTTAGGAQPAVSLEGFHEHPALTIEGGVLGARIGAIDQLNANCAANPSNRVIAGILLPNVDRYPNDEKPVVQPGTAFAKRTLPVTKPQNRDIKWNFLPAENWDRDELQDRRTVLQLVSDVPPTLRYRSLFLNQCSSFRYFIESFKQGDVVACWDRSTSSALARDYAIGVIEGKTWAQMKVVLELANPPINPRPRGNFEVTSFPAAP